MKRAGQFFDLGGTLVALDGDEVALDGHGHVTLLPGVVETLAALAGTLVFVVTNQATIPVDRLEHIRCQVLAAANGVVTEFAACTHPPADGCPCRKPRPGLVSRLAGAYGIDLSRSLLVGDTETDRLLARAAGIGRFRWAAEYFRETDGGRHTS